MRFSLVVPTLNRVQEVAALLESLKIQSIQDFEVLIVDQNGDDRLLPIIAAFADTLNIKHIRSDVRTSSHARNVALQECRGEIIAFPDDDCVYPAGVLSKVDAAFRADPKLGMLSGPAITETGELSSGRWQTNSGPITLQNVWTSAIAFTMFFDAKALNRVGNYDEALGVNAKYGSCEETDLAIRVIKTGATCRYDFDLRVIHPDKVLTTASLKRAFAYGTGMGYVLRKHRIDPATVATFLIRPVGGVGLSLLRGKTVAAKYYWSTFTGRLSGFLAPQETRPEYTPPRAMQQPEAAHD